jgi:hypothetical protein
MLRTVYQPNMRIQFNLKSMLLQKFRRNMESWAEGKEISIPLHAGRTGGYGFSDTGALPTADAQQVARANFNYSRLYGRIQLDAAHMKGAAKSYAAEARPFSLETKSLVRQLRNTLNFHLFGDGTGLLTSFPTGQTVDSSSGVTEVIVDSVKGLHLNQRVDLLLIADGTMTGTGFRYGKITSIVVATKTIQITVAEWTEETFNGAENTFALYQSLTASASSYGAVFNGLTSACGTTGTYGGINRATAGNEYWQGQTIDAGTAEDPWLALLQEAVDLVDIHSDGAVDLMITTHEVWTHLMNHLVAQKRFTGETKLNGWARALDFNGIPIVRDKHCPAATLFALDTSTFTIYQDSEGEWMHEDGAVLHRVQDFEAYEATWSRYLELVCDKPNANCIVTDLIDTYPTADFVAPASGG